MDLSTEQFQKMNGQKLYRNRRILAQVWDKNQSFHILYKWGAESDHDLNIFV